jgi:hypothetical protein
VAVVPHLRLSWGGTLGFPALETWSNTLGLLQNPEAAGVAPTQVQIEQLVEACAEPVSNWFTSADARIGSDAQLVWLKAAWVLASGLQRDVNTARHDFDNQTYQGAIAGPVIWEQTYAITWRTFYNRGRGHAGRIYPPLVNAPPVNGTPYCSVAQANGMATAAAGLLTALHAASVGVMGPGADLLPCVVSKSTDGSGQPAKNTMINGVVVDRVADIQHRRVNRVARAEGTRVVLDYATDF